MRQQPETKTGISIHTGVLCPQETASGTGDTTVMYAHTKKNTPPETGWQRLLDHLQNAAQHAANAAVPFQSEPWAHNAALLHDLGKANPVFQKGWRLGKGKD